MQYLASLLFLLLRIDLSAAAPIRPLVRPFHVLAFLVRFPSTFPLLHRLEDAFIGLSCMAIAATLVSFIYSAGRRLPFRPALITLAALTALTGLSCLLSVTILQASLGWDLWRTVPPTFLGTILAILAAFLLPFLLPFLLSKSREIDSITLSARQNETRFLAATQNTSDAFMLLEAARNADGDIEDFRFTYVNGNAGNIIKKLAAEILGSRLTSVLPMDPAGRLLEQYRQVVRTGRALTHEFPLDAHNPNGPWMRHHVAKVEDGLAITASDLTERTHVNHKLHQLKQDALTGLPNRFLLDDRLQQAIARADRYRNQVALYLVNIDAFQEINERHGRALGDQVLVALATRLRSAVRATDSVLRLGGDEFLVIMPDMLLEIDVRRAAATLLAILREPLNLKSVRGDEVIQAFCSLGVAIYPDSAKTVTGLLTHADAAMARAKVQGSNQYVVYAAQDSKRDDAKSSDLKDDEEAPGAGSSLSGASSQYYATARAGQSPDASSATSSATNFKTSSRPSSKPTSVLGLSAYPAPKATPVPEDPAAPPSPS